MSGRYELGKKYHIPVTRVCGLPVRSARPVILEGKETGVLYQSHGDPSRASSRDSFPAPYVPSSYRPKGEQYYHRQSPYEGSVKYGVIKEATGEEQAVRIRSVTYLLPRDAVFEEKSYQHLQSEAAMYQRLFGIKAIVHRTAHRSRRFGYYMGEKHILVTPDFGHKLSRWTKGEPQIPFEKRKQVHAPLLPTRFSAGRPIHDRLKILKRIAEQIKIIHAHDYGHYDLKVQNIAMNADDEIQIIDLESVEHLAPGEMPHKFSLKYSAPEILEGKVDLISPQADLYSFGKICAELLPECGFKTQVRGAYLGGLDVIRPEGEDGILQAMIRRLLNPTDPAARGSIEDAIADLDRMISPEPAPMPKTRRLYNHLQGEIERLIGKACFKSKTAGRLQLLCHDVQNTEARDPIESISQYQGYLRRYMEIAQQHHRVFSRGKSTTIQNCLAFCNEAVGSMTAVAKPSRRSSVVVPVQLTGTSEAATFAWD